MKRAALLLLLIGCHKPLVTCPEPPVLTWPALVPVTLQTSDADTARAYVVNQRTLKAHLAEALELLNGYRASSPKTIIPGASK